MARQVTYEYRTSMETDWGRNSTESIKHSNRRGGYTDTIFSRDLNFAVTLI